MSKVAVIIPVLAGVTDEYAKLCIKSLRDTTDWDIVVVSNGSNIKPDFGELKKSITMHLHTRDQGQCNAVNIGVAAIQAEYIFVTNDDMYYAPNWKDNLEFVHDVFSPNLVEPTNNAGSAKPFRKFDGGFTLDEFKKEEVDNYIKEATETPAGEETGFNLPFFIKRDLYIEIGGYDKAYDPWGSNSDTDLQTKINLAGITPIRDRNVLVYHFSNKSGTFDNSDPIRQAAWQFNWDYFQEKWGFNRDQLKSDVWYNKDMLPKNKEDIVYKPEWAGKYK